MPQLTTYQGVVDEAEVIPVELIGDYIAAYELPQTVGLGLVWSQPGRGNVPRTFPRWDELQDVAGAVTGVPAGTKLETDQFEYREIPMSEETITPGLVGFRIVRSDEAMAEAPAGLAIAEINEAVRHAGQRLDVDLLSAITSLPNTQGLVTDVYNRARVQADIAAFKLLNAHGGRKAAVISPGMFSELIADIHSTTATMVMDERASLGLDPESGYQGTFHGVDFYESQNLPASGAGAAGVMTVMGARNSCLGAVINELPNVRITRGDEMESRAATQYVFRMWYGFGVTNPNRGQQILGAA